MFIRNALDLFLDDCYIRGLSETTIVNYSSMVGYFIDYVGDIDLSLIVNDTIKSYTRQLLKKNKENTKTVYNRPISRQTVRTYLKQLSVFFNWCKGEEIILGITKPVTLPKKQNKYVEIYTDEEIQLIFNSFNNHDSWIQFRNYTLLALLYDSGLRRNEACQLLIHNVYFDSNLIKVLGKGSKERLVPLGSLTKQYLQNYLKVVPYEINDHVFLSQYGDPLSGNAVEDIFYRIRKKTGINVSAHKLRHNFGTNYLLMQYERDGKADIYQLMTILGHSDVDTTMVYLHLAQQIIIGRNHVSKLDDISSCMPNPTKTPHGK